MQTVIDTQGLGPTDREELWRHAMTDTFVSVSIGDFTERGAYGNIAADWVGQMMVGHVDAAGQDIHRTPRHVSQAPAEFFQVALMSAGTARMGQDGRRAVLAPGDLLVYETNRPFEWLFDGGWNTWVFSFPTELITLSPDQRRLLTARRISGSAGLGGLVSRFLSDLAAHSAELSGGAEAERLVQHAGDLVVTMLSDATSPTEPVRASVDRTVVLRAKDYVDQHLRDVDLSPPEVARAVGVSVRYLHQLFGADGLTVAGYIRERRLEAVRRALLAPGLRHRNISSLAFESGFGDISGFNRAFRNRYGMTPSDVRRPPEAR